MVAALVGKKRLNQNAQRTGGKGKPKVIAVARAVPPVATGVTAVAAPKATIFASARDLWGDVARQAAVDNELNVGRLKGRVGVANGRITRGKVSFDVAKLVKKLGTDVCLPVAIGTSETAAYNVVFCDKGGEAGHEHDGKAHRGLEKWAKDFNDHNSGEAYRQGFV